GGGEGEVGAGLAGGEEVGIGRIGSGEAGLAAADGVPVTQVDAEGRQAVAGSGRSSQVLHRPGHVVRHAVIDADVIKLSDGQGGRVPGFAAVGRNIHAAIVAVDDPPWAARVDPDVVVVAVVGSFDARNCLAAVDGFEERYLGKPDNVGVGRINRQRRVVPRALA